MLVGFNQLKKAETFYADYEEVLSKIDAMEVLEHYDARNIREQGDEIIHSCLIDTVKPHHSNGDESPSASLNSSKLLYGCWSYGGGDLLWLVQEMEDCTRFEALQRLSNFIIDSDEPVQSDIDLINRLYGNRESIPTPIPKYSTIMLEPWLLFHPYMTEVRGIRESTLERYMVGYDDTKAQIILPHFWKGKLVGYQRRRLDDPRWPTTPKTDSRGNFIPKYKNSPDFPKDKTIYNLDTVINRKKSSVVVVESVLSVLKAESWVDEGAIEWDNVVATFGGKVTDSQIDILSRFDEITIWLDNDVAGWSGTLKLCKGLSDHNVWIVESPLEKDLADLDPEQAELLLKYRAPAELAEKILLDRMTEVKNVQKVLGRGKR